MKFLLCASTFGALSALLIGCGGGGRGGGTTTTTTSAAPTEHPTPAPTPPPTPMPPIPDLENRNQCSKIFDACGKLQEAGDCFLEGSITAKQYPSCNDKLPQVVSDFTSKQYHMDSQREYMLAGIAGGVLGKVTCATALRYLHFSNKQCPMPNPPDQPVISVSGETFSLFAIGDWGPTPLGYAAGGPNQCKCGEHGLCHASVYEHKANYGKTGSEGQYCVQDGAYHNNAQQSVADAMAYWAQSKEPVAVVNVGDNFYLGGLAGPWINQGQQAFGFTQVNAQMAFTETWGNVYMKNRHDISKKLHVPWLSVLGNHDYGGEGCLADWQAQIEFTASDPYKSWTMPWQYYKKRVKTAGFFLDIFMTEANIDDSVDGGKSVCQQHVCPADAGPDAKGDVAKCKSRYGLWNKAGLAWLDREMETSKKEGAHWQIVVGHYSDEVAGEERFRRMSSPGNGINSVYIGGHTHKQWVEAKHGPMVVCTGGGGGYDLDDESHGWGFTSITVSKEKIDISLVRAMHPGDRGIAWKNVSVPHPTQMPSKQSVVESYV